jgi:hypothetical protein
MQGQFDSECKKLYAVIIGQCTEYMMAKLNGIPSFKTIHTEKDSLALLKVIKGLIFRFNGKKEFEMSLVEANNMLHKMYQTKEITSVQFRDKFKKFD